MNIDLLYNNLTNPTLLFFILGVFATLLKSDLEVPSNTSKFLSIYLLFSIGFRGGQELSHGGNVTDIFSTLFLALFFSVLTPIVAFFLLKKRFGIYNAAAVAATYGSVSAVTFITASGFLESEGARYGGHMVAAMALMEAPAIMIGLFLVRRFAEEDEAHPKHSLWQVAREALTNGSVLMVLGSLIIGMLTSSKQAAGIKPFTSDIFQGFLAVFLLDMGMVAAQRFKTFRHYGRTATLFALLLPVLNGLICILITGLMSMNPADRLMLTVLAASASYIAVPAAMRFTIPQADPGLYIPMALGVTFPFNITIGIPLYWSIIQCTG
ncbi:MAG TPA: sodium-dependent bicarbonate transport family permease [Saprospiraceae bacterium]|nr:sodium-dependent bicarbonate transport family permease [Saprospiraceae bacterium]HNM26059.1 sodium-dependent bicarbonate transport family permease [Saprospiraceae bacterium]